MCGVGALINDDVYCDALEHLTVEDVPVVDAVKASGWPTDEQSLWMYGRIQQIHDSLLADHGDTFRRQWYHQCCELAAALDLTAPDRPNLRGR